MSAETADLLDDLRAIEPGDDLAVAIADIALDRIEDALRDAFDGDPSVRIKFNAPILGEVNLGRPRADRDVRFGCAAHPRARPVRRCRGRRRRTLASMLGLEADLGAAGSRARAASAIKDEADQRIAETARRRTRSRDRRAAARRRGHRPA